MKILVTGSQGFLGKNLVPYLRGNQIQAIGLDKLPSPDCLNYPLGTFDPYFTENFVSTYSDLECIIHLASESHVDRSISGPREFVENNVAGTLELFELARRLPALKQIIMFSTDEVGACLEEGSFFERGRDFKCGSVYSATKGAQELLAQAYINTHGLPIVTTRCVNIFGPHQADEKFLPTVIRKALMNELIPIYGSGMQMRQWVHVDHICEFLNSLATSSFVPPGSVLHIGGTSEIYNKLLAHTVLSLLGKPASLIGEVEDRLGHDSRYSLGVSEETQRFGFSAYDPKNFLTDLQGTIEWYVDYYGRK